MYAMVWLVVTAQFRCEKGWEVGADYIYIWDKSRDLCLTMEDLPPNVWPLSRDNDDNDDSSKIH